MLNGKIMMVFHVNINQRSVFNICLLVGQEKNF